MKMEKIPSSSYSIWVMKSELSEIINFNAPEVRILTWNEKSVFANSDLKIQHGCHAYKAVVAVVIKGLAAGTPDCNSLNFSHTQYCTTSLKVHVAMV